MRAVKCINRQPFRGSKAVSHYVAVPTYACPCCSALYGEDLPACPGCGWCSHPEREPEYMKECVVYGHGVPDFAILSGERPRPGLPVIRAWLERRHAEKLEAEK